MPGSSSKAVPLCSKPPVCSARHLAAPSIGKKGGSSLNVLGVGSGSGKIDLEILGKIQSKHPGFFIHNEVVEPNPQHISKYKALVKEWNSGPNISFTWNQMTSGEYEMQNKKRNESKKFDFIHMIEMLYYVESLHDTIKYFHSLLETNGKLLIVQTAVNLFWKSSILTLMKSSWPSKKKNMFFWGFFLPGLTTTFMSGVEALGKWSRKNLYDGGYHSLWRKAGSRFLSSCLFLDVHKVLDEIRMKYHIYELSSIFDITECFIEGNENGELLLDFLTHIVDFRKTAPADLKAEVLQCLRQPQCSREENGKILFNNNLHFIVIDY
ncbi:histamine N-methyltransferase isoform X2 [Chiloscyllium punctatum]|uniref:histamine N-methyltransferase isoform X2 n=1 Tax=Chiloscyllium punctatum TaxID=137246 RepID=UPI003B638A31